MTEVAENPKRFAKPDADRFSGKPQINKLKAANIATAGDHAAWAEAFAKDFTASLPRKRYSDAELIDAYESGDGILPGGPTMRHWLVGVKVTTYPGGPGKQDDLYLRLKVWSGARGDGDKRCWVYVTLGSQRNPAELAAEVVSRMDAQPAKKHIVDRGNGNSGPYGHSVLYVGK